MAIRASITFDGNGSVTAKNIILESWTGIVYAAAGSIDALSTFPTLPDPASYWPQSSGNPSANGTAVVQCPCLLQSAGFGANVVYGGTPDDTRSERGKLIARINPPPDFVLLVGDAGLGDHNVRNLFNLAAGTEQDNLNGQGNLAFAPIRISSVQDFANQLVGNGWISGGVEYFGHGVDVPYTDGTWGTQLSPGEQAGPNTNITKDNVNLLKNTQLDTHAAVPLRACDAGYGSGRYSIAQLIANQLQRKVFASAVRQFFSTDPNARFPIAQPLPNNKPIYLIPLGGGRLVQFNPSLSH